jgi:hypothetical protein
MTDSHAQIFIEIDAKKQKVSPHHMHKFKDHCLENDEFFSGSIKKTCHRGKYMTFVLEIFYIEDVELLIILE